MRITGLTVHYRYWGHRSWIITEMSTDEGITGWSEVGKSRERSVGALIGELEPFLLGKDPTRIEQLFEQLYRMNFWIGTTEMTAFSAVETCMWDILGKSLNAPVYRLLGGACRDRIRLYAHLHPVGDPATPAAWAAGARQRVAEGYTATKCSVDFLGLTRASPSRLFRDEPAVSNRLIEAAREFLGAVRDAVGPRVDLMVDCSGRFGPAEAIRLGSALEDVGLLFFEEPCPPEDVEATLQVGRAIKTPVATGERLLGRHGFWDLLAGKGVAVVQPDVTNAGGIAETKKIAAMAEARYASVAPHNPNGPLATAQNAHLCAAIPNFLILESVGSPEFVAACNETLTRPLVIRDGYLELPTGPGLGVEPDRDDLARNPYRPPAHF